jgi:hypothetical protein
MSNRRTRTEVLEKKVSFGGGAGLWGRLAASGMVCAILSSAIALAQTTKTAVKPADTKPAAKESAAPVAKKAVQRNLVVLNVNDHIQFLKEQFVQQGRPLIRSELMFVRHVCCLTADQTRPIAREAEQVFEKIAEKLADDQFNGRLRVVAMGNQPATPQPYEQLQEILAVSLKKHLNPAQWDRYQAETQKRTADRKEAGVRFLTESLTRDLTLSDRQRELVSQAIAKSWDDRWSLAVDYLFLGSSYYPQGLDGAIMSLLDDAQTKVWRSAEKLGQFWGFNNPFSMVAVHDGDPLAAELGFNLEPAHRAAVKAELRFIKKAVDPATSRVEPKKAGIQKK